MHSSRRSGVFRTSGGEDVEIERRAVADDFDVVHDVARNVREATRSEAHHLVTDMKIDKTFEDVDDLLVGMRVRLELMTRLKPVQGKGGAVARKCLALDARP